MLVGEQARRSTRRGSGTIACFSDVDGLGVLVARRPRTRLGTCSGSRRCSWFHDALHLPVAQRAADQARRAGRGGACVPCGARSRCAPAKMSCAASKVSGSMIASWVAARTTPSRCGRSSASSTRDRARRPRRRGAPRRGAACSRPRGRCSGGLRGSARTATFDHAPPLAWRWRLRAGSCADGDGMPSRGEALGDRVQAAAAEELVEDPLHDRRRDRVGLESMQALTDRGLRWVRMRTGVGEHVAVRRSSAEEAALDRGLCGHRGADAGLDPVAFALAHAAVEAHHEVVRVRAGIDRAADLGHPQLDAVVDEHREREPELVAVERALRFADHDRVEAAVGVAERVEQGATPRDDASTAAIATDRCRSTRRRSRRRPAR